MKYTIDDYVKAREQHDYPNAIAIWDAIAEANDAYIRKHNASAFNPALPAIFSAFMPKSGGTFLHNRLMKTVGYLDYYWAITHVASAALVYPTPRAVEVYQRGGYTCHTHATPSPYFRFIVEPRVSQPIWVHVRHPAEACLAGFYHFKGEGQGEGEVHRQRLAEIEHDKTVLGEIHGFTFDEPWPEFFATHCKFYVEWLDTWIAYADRHPGRVVFSFFDELSDVDALLTRILAIYGFDLKPRDVPETIPEDRRRTSGTRDWRAGLTDATSALVHRADDVWSRAQAFRASPAVPAA